MALTDIEVKVVKTCCELNDNLTLSVRENDGMLVYRSRFFSVDFKQGFIIIDEPSPEDPDAGFLSKGQYFEIFFEFNIFRYIFESRVLDHTMFTLNDRSVHALRISLPGKLTDGDKREYFRVETGMRPPVPVRFNILKKGADSPLKSGLTRDEYDVFEGEMVDISGGGFALRRKPGDKQLILERGDIINARFKLKPGFEEMEIWSEVRDFRKYKDTEINVWGLRFLGKERNKHINYYRNKIMRYVVERQREILSK
jgi:c-di-GMP-binding flagellar brake protein YcgR